MKRMVVLALLLVAVGVGCGCSRDSAPVVAAATTEAKAVPAAEPKAAVSDYYETTGPLVVENQVDVLAQREGVVAKILVETGTRVQKGEVLAQFDDRQLRADREAAEAKMRSIEADMRTEEEEAKVLDSDYQRDRQLYAAGLITDKLLEHSLYKKNGSAFLLERERQNLKNAKASLRSLELELEKARISAPFSGVVARRYVRVGQKVAANDRLFWVTETSPVSVQFTLPETFAGRIKAGEKVIVSSPFHPNDKYAAKVRAVSPVVDPTSGTIEVRAELVDRSPALVPGTSANVLVTRPK